MEREKVDIVLCDVKLPDGNGVDFVKTIRPLYQLMETILLTETNFIAMVSHELKTPI